MKLLNKIWIFCALALSCGLNPEFKNEVYTEPNNGITVPSDDAEISEFIAYATMQSEKGDFQEAIVFFSKAYDRAIAINDEKQVAILLNNLGLTYWRLEDNLQAMDCYVASLKISEKIKLDRLTGLLYNNISLIQKQEEDYTSALENSDKAIEIFSQTDFNRDLGISHNNKGQIFKKLFFNDSAMVQYQKALDAYQKTNYADGIAATYHNISEILMRKGENEMAIHAALSSLKYAQESNSRLREKEAYANLSEIFEKNLLFDSALVYFKKYQAIHIEDLEKKLSENLIAEQTKLGVELKNLQIHNLQQEKLLMKNRWGIGVLSVLMILLVGSFIGYRNYSRIKLKKNELEIQLVSSREILEVKLKELKNYILDVSKKNETIKELQLKLSHKSSTAAGHVAELLEQKILTDDDWIEFKNKFSSIYPEFIPRIKLVNSQITEAETRLLVLMRLNLSGKEMAEILAISPQSVRATKVRLKKKLNELKFETVEEFLETLLCIFCIDVQHVVQVSTFLLTSIK